MPESVTWQLLVVDNDPDTCDAVHDALHGEAVDGVSGTLNVIKQTTFDTALTELQERQIDLVILDLSENLMAVDVDEEPGRRILRQIKQWRFVPVIFYTTWPEKLQDLEGETPLVQVVPKTSGALALLAPVNAVIASRLPAVNRALVRYLENVQRDYMWGFVAKHWAEYAPENDASDLAYLLARRLASALSGSGIDELIRDLGGTGYLTTANKIHPMRYYIRPPVEEKPMAGDLFFGSLGSRSEATYWILLTPSCDMAQAKANWVTLAQCDSLSIYQEYQDWKDNHSNTKMKALQELMSNNRKLPGTQSERYFFLPHALDLPDLVVDFQHLITIPATALSSEPQWKRLASLDNPFAEALVARFTRYFGRLGTPDLDTDKVIERLDRGSAASAVADVAPSEPSADGHNSLSDSLPPDAPSASSNGTEK